jgi:hypothetical protein
MSSGGQLHVAAQSILQVLRLGCWLFSTAIEAVIYPHNERLVQLWVNYASLHQLAIFLFTKELASWAEDQGGCKLGGSCRKLKNLPVQPIRYHSRHLVVVPFLMPRWTKRCWLIWPLIFWSNLQQQCMALETEGYNQEHSVRGQAAPESATKDQNPSIRIKLTRQSGNAGSFCLCKDSLPGLGHTAV